MISTRTAAGGETAIVIDDGSVVAFVDRDWVHPGSDVPTCALMFDADGSLSWGTQELSTDAGEPATRAGQLLSRFADDVVNALEDVDPARVLVTGSGLVAAEVRRRLGSHTGTSKQRPLAVAEMTGSTAELETATRSVEDGGLVVLAGEPAGPVEINLYSDVHRRGLRVVGIPGPGHPREAGTSRRHELAEPVAVRSGEPLPSGLWYRVTAGLSLADT
jgi:hypothetical protein